MATRTVADRTRREEKERKQRVFSLAPLPYEFDALEPVIDRESLQWHYDVIHRGYVDYLNTALGDSPSSPSSLEGLLAKASRYPGAVRAAAGGHWNHSFFWNVMTDRQENHEMPPSVLSALERRFGSFERFKSLFVRAGTEHLGSGWIWLLRKRSGKLILVTSRDHDNPLMDDAAIKGEPLLVCDLWEHAYFLRFKARREEFLRRFFTIINWSRVEKLLLSEYH